MQKDRLVWLALLSLLASTIACGQSSGIGIGVAPEAGPTSTPPPTLPPTPTQWPTPVNQPWRTVAMGIERRDLPVHGPHFRFPATARLIRIDPTLVKMHIHYSPEVPITVEEWQRETRATVVVNGGFFDAAKRTEGLLAGYSETYGISYATGGMFYIQNGQVFLRDLTEEPYRQEEQLQEAMQSYPMLVSEKKAVHPGEDFRYNRRTAIGIDSLGRVVVVVFDEPVVSLHELSLWLAGSDLDLEVALNLDGGSSTGMVVAAGDEETLINSQGPIPIVIAAYP
jgi:hypothetical protein